MGRTLGGFRILSEIGRGGSAFNDRLIYALSRGAWDWANLFAGPDVIYALDLCLPKTPSALVCMDL